MGAAGERQRIDRPEPEKSGFGRRSCNVGRQFFCLNKKLCQFPGHCLTFGIGNFPARNQNQPANFEIGLEQSVTLPQQPSGPIPFDCQQTVFFSTYNPAAEKSIRGGRYYCQKKTACVLYALLTDLVKVRFETQFVRLVQRTNCVTCGMHQAVRRARPF